MDVAKAFKYTIFGADGANQPYTVQSRYRHATRLPELFLCHTTLFAKLPIIRLFSRRSIADCLLPVLANTENTIRELETVPKRTTNLSFVSVAEWADTDSDIIGSHQRVPISTAF